MTSNKLQKKPNKNAFGTEKKSAPYTPETVKVLNKSKDRSLLWGFPAAYECHKIRIASPDIPRLSQGIFLCFLPYILVPYTVQNQNTNAFYFYNSHLRICQRTY